MIAGAISSGLLAGGSRGPISRTFFSVLTDLLRTFAERGKEERCGNVNRAYPVFEACRATAILKVLRGD